MAGLCGLKILLLWAGIIALSKCQDNPTTPPSITAAPPSTKSSPSPTNKPQTTPSPPDTHPTTTTTPTTTGTLPPSTMAATTAMPSNSASGDNNPTLTSPTVASDSSSQTLNSTNVSATPTPTTTAPPSNMSLPTSTNQPSSQANTTQKQTSPPVTHPNTTTTPTTTDSAPPLCSYTVTPIKYGLQVKILSSTNGTYNINMNEEGQPEEKFTRPVSFSSENIAHDIKPLKPCTKYEHSVTFIGGSGKEIFCNRTENKTMTDEMSEQDIKVSNCKPGYVCYESDWNIGSSISGGAKSCNNKQCVKLGDDNICSDLTTNFKSTNCENSSFTITTSITAGFLDENEILKSLSNELPPKIESKLPPKCKNLSIDYTCSEPGKQTEPKILSQLEPFTNYSCVGHIKNDDITIKYTPAITFRVDCDLEIQRQTSNTNTSIELSWTTTSQNCRDVLPKLEKFSYTCTCSPSNQKHRANKTTDGGTCKFTGLQPYTDYVCNIQPTYNNKDVSKSVKVNVKTNVGIPEDISTDLTVTVAQHNMIRVTCDYSYKHENGPQKKYIARLFYKGDNVKLLENGTCNFEFKDLSYSTSYTVQVTVFNGRFESSTTKDVDTLYNDKAVIGILIFLIILTSVTLLLVIYKICTLKCNKSK